MPLIIESTRLTSFSVDEGENNEVKIDATYSLIGPGGKKIGAPVSLSSKNGYGTSQFVPSPQLQKQIREVCESYRKEIEMTIGLA